MYIVRDRQRVCPVSGIAATGVLVRDGKRWVH
jgi:hypothetical protein